MRTVLYRIHDWTVRIVAPGERVFGYFDAFYDRAPQPTGPQAEPALEVTVLRPPPWSVPVRDHRMTGWGVVIDAAADGHRFWLYATTADDEEVSATARRLVRHAWFDRLARTCPLLVLHASAVDDGRRIIAFAGEKWSGKTTLLLDALAGRRHRLITNDSLLIFGDRAGTVLTGAPTLVRIRRDTVERFDPFLAARARRDPVNRRSYQRFRALPGRGADDALLLSYGAFGDLRMPHVQLSERELVLVDTTFSADGRVSITEPPNPARALRRLVLATLKTGDAAGSMSAGRLYPAPPLPPLDVPDLLVAELQQHARPLLYRHRGEVRPVVEYLDDRRPGSVAVGNSGD